MELISADLEEAMSAGTFTNPADNHISRTPLSVDQEGWKEVLTLLASTLDELLAIQGRVSNRVAPDAETMLTKIEIIQFRSPHPSKRTKP
jgi:hypothetical protein